MTAVMWPACEPRTDGVLHEHKSHVRKCREISAPHQVCSRQRPRPARGRTLRVVLQEDRKRLRPRNADAPALLRYAVLHRTRKDGDARHRKPRKESVMKCSNPNCSRGIGLVAHRRGWFGKRLYCSRRCRDAFVAQRRKRSQQERTATTYFEWLLLQPIGNPRPNLATCVMRVKAR
jgi:hypothetical protein